MLSDRKTTAIAVKSIIITFLFAFLTSCGQSAAIENLVSPDPKLTQKINNKDSLIAKINPKDSPEKRIEENQTIENPPTRTKAKTEPALPEDFPSTLPLYPEAELQSVKLGAAAAIGQTNWRAQNKSEEIITYYQEKLADENWQITQPFILDTDQKINKAIAIKDNLKLIIEIAESSPENEATKFTLAYQAVKQDSANSFTSSTKIEPEGNIIQSLPNSAQKQHHNQPQKTPVTSSETYFSDLNEVPEQLLPYVKDVADLGILTPYTQNGNIELSKFAPNEPVTRSEYARWLIAANNKYYQDSPGNKIHVVTKTQQPAFQDIEQNNPDFGVIQGLAEAGLVPSMLTDDGSKLLFRPNAPLKREDLVTWKVPLDLRKALPKASIDTIAESWGFQDIEQIDPEALQALFADFQNGERANISRIFGYTTLFQPKKPVTRAEAAASLWYFGFKGDGITAPEVSKLKETE